MTGSWARPWLKMMWWDWREAVGVVHGMSVCRVAALVT